MSKDSEKTEKILCVDDSDIVHTVVEAALKGSFDVTFESEGVNAIQRALEIKPDVILLDYHMPGVNGVEVLKQIKSDPRLDQVLVIFLTGIEDPSLQHSLTQQGASGLIQKPVNVKTLSSDLKKILKSFSILKESPDRSRKVFINQYIKEERRLIDEAIQIHLDLGKPIAIISINGGDQFLDKHPHYMNQVLKGDITYLQVKPSLLVRMPYLEDMFSVRVDLEQLLQRQLNEFFWIILQPELILDYGKSDNSRTIARSFNIFVEKSLGEVSYFLSMRTFPEERKQINELANILCA